jgi:lysyl-tRNA synthetase class 2
LQTETIMTETTAAVPDENHLIAERRAKLAALRTQGVAFPNDFVPADRAQALHTQYGEKSKLLLPRPNTLPQLPAA